MASLFIRMLYSPLNIYQQTCGIKMKLLQPDIDEFQQNIKRHQKNGNTNAAKAERNKMLDVRKRHGIFGSIQIFQMSQIFFHMGAVSLVNRYSFNIDAESRMLTEGMLWFKDLSAPDPYGVLPVVGSFLIFLNIMMGSTSNISPMM